MFYVECAPPVAAAVLVRILASEGTSLTEMGARRRRTAALQPCVPYVVLTSPHRPAALLCVRVAVEGGHLQRHDREQVVFLHGRHLGHALARVVGRGLLGSWLLGRRPLLGLGALLLALVAPLPAGLRARLWRGARVRL